MQVDIVVSTDYQREVSDVRRAIIYEVDKNKIVLSQTNPPFTRFYLNKGMAITYLTRKGAEKVRVGYFGQLMDIFNFSLSSAQTVQAVAIFLKSGAELHNLRMHFRVRPVADPHLAIYCGNQRLNIIDISIGGAMLSHTGGWTVEPRDLLKITLVVEGEKFEMDANVTRKWSPYTDRKGNLEYISIQFAKMDKRLNYLLGGKIFSIERENRTKL